MNLTRCTDDQRSVVTTLDAPLMVSAGAGSGKTFTLTQRVAYALAPGEGAAPFLDSVDELMAITYTTKAADELKSRIKGLLLDEHLDEEALKVDEAWVSTIHGMASRILREHALEIGIDPAFEVIADTEAERLLDEALEQVVVQARHSEDRLVAELLRTEKLKGSSSNDKGVVDYAKAVLDRVHAMPNGFAALDYRSQLSTPAQLVRCEVEAAQELLAAGRAWEGKLADTTVLFLDTLEDAIEQAHQWLSSPHASSFASDDFDAEDFCRVFYSFPTKPRSVREPYLEALEPWWLTIHELESEARAHLALGWQEAVVRVARQVDAVYEELKGPGRLDNTDLLVRCSRALQEHPAIAEALRDKFKLIMVDEFQDTDRLQVDIIGRIAKPGLANVCTVGDAQQSIYRFRGADVNVFFEYRENLRKQAGKDALVEMRQNFRSHGDILAFVERIFSAREAFGDDFLKLEAKGSVNEEPDEVFDGFPRVQVDVTHYKSDVGKNDARDESARAIAGHFRELAARGARLGDMVVLLGKMTHADAYAAALREVGIASVISGGSVFADMEEPKLVSMLLRLAVNRDDSEALYTVLASRLFAISDDVLLALATRFDNEGTPHRQSLARGLFSESLTESLAIAGVSENDVRATLLCKAMLDALSSTARSKGPAQALRNLLVESGLLDRLQGAGVEGVASAANFAKALRLVDQFEKMGTGTASVAEAYQRHLDIAKEAPGALATADGDFVRIMTVHASKGLEFPHVAVAELKDGKDGSSRLVAENIGQRTFLSTGFVPIREWRSSSDKMVKVAEKVEGAEPLDIDAHDVDGLDDLLAALGAGARHEALSAYAKNQALAEARRLLYVALTRASKSLFVSLLFSSKPADGYGNAGIYEDIFRAVPWDTAADCSVAMADYGGSAPARIAFRLLAPGDEEGNGEAGSETPDATCEAEVGEGEPFPVPLRVPLPDPVFVPHRFAHENLFSYSSLSGVHAHADVPVEAPEASGVGFDLDTGDGVAPAVPLMAASLATPDDADGAPVEDATALGRAFHRLAQQAIERSTQGKLFEPGPAAVEAQIRKEALSAGQQERLRTALDLWLSSDEAVRFASHENRSAEVPFTVRIPASRSDAVASDAVSDVASSDTSPDVAPSDTFPDVISSEAFHDAILSGVRSAESKDLADGIFFLEGEIDGLADNDDGAAFLIDYKTGGHDDETPEQLDAKHRLQASCYAYALLRAGYTSVDAHFLRIERPSAANPRDPQIVPYHFETADLPALEALIIERQREALAKS